MLETEARLAELWVLQGGRHDAALGLTDDLAGQPTEPVLQATVLRVAGYARLQAGDREGAIAVLNESRSCAADAGSDYELALTLAALVLADAPDAEGLRAESVRLLADLGVEVLPEVPVPS